VTEIVRRIAGLDPVKRGGALGQLIVLAGLRGLEETVEEEIRKMPIFNDIMDHKVLGREYKRGRAAGIEDGRRDGIQQGELRVLRRLLEKRLGPVPPRAGNASAPGRRRIWRRSVSGFWKRGVWKICLGRTVLGKAGRLSLRHGLPTQTHVELSFLDQILNRRVLQILGSVSLYANCFLKGE